jgi:amidase
MVKPTTMNRRNFLRNGSLAGLSLTFLATSSCDTKKKSTDESPEGRDNIDHFTLNEITVDELQQKMSGGDLTCRTITELYLKRIEAIDNSGPGLNSIIEVNPDALTIADELDKERKAGKLRGPLHGIPVLIKDNINTGDKMMTTAGSLALEGNIASQDAFIVAQLRKAGAVLLGKTNLSEWANFRSERSTSGWSSRGGQTRNPFVLDRNPCGSSSGSGSAVSANLCVMAIGTETNGSIACPSSTNGVVGIKPTVGLWSRSGIIPISATQDTAGPMTRTVKDAVLLLGALAGIDPDDKATSASEGKYKQDYTSHLRTDGLKGKRIGVEKQFLKSHESVDSILSKALDQIRNAGAEVVEVELISKTRPVGGEEYKVLKYEFKDGVNKYLSKANAKVKSLEEVIKFNTDNEARAMPYFKQEILESSQALGDLNSKEYKDALDKLLKTVRGAIDGLFKEHKLDAICGPANGPSWCIDMINGDYFTGYGTYSPAAIAGYPSITVPMGQVFELPIGLSFIGKPFGEGELIEVAYAYEQASKNRVAPKFLKTI